ncbi:MAG TPA: cysteine desulfurase [Planctomycetota bacterium]|nr:cysteine desulfurase [Planctomycetota bacterium]
MSSRLVNETKTVISAPPAAAEDGRCHLCAECHLDAECVRRDFPILNQKVNGGKPLVYLDSAATSQKPRQVIEAMNRYYEFSNANVHRGLHVLAERATEIYEGARVKVAKFINAERPEEIVWTKNASEAINLVAHGYGRKFLKAGDEILVSHMEHHSNLVPWHLLAKDKGCVVKAVKLKPDGTLDLEHFDQLLASGKVKLVALTHVSNVLGTINPITKISTKVHAAGAVFVVDGCQAVPHLPVDIRTLGADFYAFSGHKMCAPTGIGVLYGRYELLDQMNPFLGGGEMIEEVRVDSSTYKEPPARFEAGTPPIGETAGIAAAVDYLSRIGMEFIRTHEKELVRYALEKLQQIKGLKIHGPLDPELRSGVISFEFEDIHAHDIAHSLDVDHGVAVRAGHHCAQPLMEWLDAASTARLSVYMYTTKAEIDVLVEGLKKVRERFEAA